MWEPPAPAPRRRMGEGQGAALSRTFQDHLLCTCHHPNSPRSPPAPSWGHSDQPNPRCPSGVPGSLHSRAGSREFLSVATRGRALPRNRRPRPCSAPLADSPLPRGRQESPPHRGPTWQVASGGHECPAQEASAGAERHAWVVRTGRFQDQGQGRPPTGAGRGHEGHTQRALSGDAAPAMWPHPTAQPPPGAPQGPTWPGFLPPHVPGPRPPVPPSLAVQAATSPFPPWQLPPPTPARTSGRCACHLTAHGPREVQRVAPGRTAGPGLVCLRRSGSAGPQDTHLRRGHLLLGQACREKGEASAGDGVALTPPSLPSLRSLRPCGGRAPRPGAGVWMSTPH